ncbi:MAG TPA: M56 family metallopeptidase, partial [Terracidiphilus sp.]|nr:M56 family metallopeptidase [Terracidiphilus sp.]
QFWNSGWTAALFNHLWQSTCVALVAWLLTRTLRSNPARVRYSIWMLASIKFLVPFALLANLGAQLARPDAGRQIGSALYTAADEIGRPFQQVKTAPMPDFATITRPAHLPEIVPAVLVLVWLSGVIVVVARWMLSWRRAARTAKDAVPAFEGREVLALRRAERNAGVRKPISLLVSSRAVEPGILGIMRPVLLWPAGISEKLTDVQIEAVAAHEVEHVRRRDNLTSAVHMLVEALFWFHPAVRWMGARLVEERERACDEKVVEQSARPEAYAESILKVCAFCLEPPVPCISGVSGSDLKERVLRIMTHRSRGRLDFARRFVLCAAAVLAVGVPVGFGVLHAMQAPAELVHASSGPVPTFEVASIKPNHDTRPGRMIGMSPTGFTAKHASLKELIGFAFGMRGDDQLIGAPSWANSEFFDIEAKVSEADIEAAKTLSMEQKRNQLCLMVQSLLADRFALKTNIETRELPVYALVVANGGVKMKEVQVDPFPPAGTPPPPGAHLPRLMKTGPTQYTATAFPIGEIPHWLSHFDELGNRVVVDQTGLKGNFDFVLNGISLGSIEGNHEAPDEPTTSIFTALQEQLGLKLESRKTPVEVLIVDHAEQPSAN